MSRHQFEEGVRAYWREINRRGERVRAREQEFTELPQRFSTRVPPHLTRSELKLIIEWKYTDSRFLQAKLDSLAQLPDQELTRLTSRIATMDVPEVAQIWRGAISGVGPAGISAILAAARPDAFPVIDVFALTAICHHYAPKWIKDVPRDPHGRLQPDEKSYPPYVRFCREHEQELSTSEKWWTPREVDMALWAEGKRLIETGEVRAECVTAPPR
jgi:hypothetical protein